MSNFRIAPITPPLTEDEVRNAAPVRHGPPGDEPIGDGAELLAAAALMRAQASGFRSDQAHAAAELLLEAGRLEQLAADLVP